MVVEQANRFIDEYNDETGKYDQTVSINGEVVSSLSTSMLSVSFSASTYTNHVNQSPVKPKDGVRPSNARTTPARTPALLRTVSLVKITNI